MEVIHLWAKERFESNVSANYQWVGIVRYDCDNHVRVCGISVRLLRDRKL
jgi:hypothetical protein